MGGQRTQDEPHDPASLGEAVETGRAAEEGSAVSAAPLTMSREDYETARLMTKYAVLGGTVDAPFFCKLFAEAEALRAALRQSAEQEPTS